MNRNLALRYLAYFLTILGTWVMVSLRGAANLDVLVTGTALVSLVYPVSAWAVACALHYATTGDLTPVAPAEPKARAKPPAPPLPPAA